MTEMTCREAGRIGGERCRDAHGPAFYRAIGQRGHRTQAATSTPEERQARSRKGGEATRDRLGPAHYADIGARSRAVAALGVADWLERALAGLAQAGCRIGTHRKLPLSVSRDGALAAPPSHLFYPIQRARVPE